MRTVSSRHHEDVLQYCKDIISKKIPSGIYAQKAIKRFLADRKRADDPTFPYILIPELADDAIDFAEKLKIPDLGGKRLELLPWMKFIYYNLFGFVHKLDNNIRRFRNGYVEVSRKNSKTTSLLFPMILYDFKRTPAAESFFVSKDLQQASKSYTELKNIFLETFKVNQREITITDGYGIKTKGNSFIQFFSSDARGIDGYKNSLSVIDEFHAYADDKIITAFQYGGRARPNNLVLIITSAGTNIDGPCYAENKKAKKVLNQVMTEDTYFTIIYAYDDGDDWKDPKNFIKANPSLDAIIKPEILQNDLNNAVLVPHRQADFKAKTCGIWTTATSNWIPLARWDTETRNTPADISEFEGKPCHAGLDLSSISDFTAYTKCFEKDGRYYLFHKFYIPSETVRDRYAHENINIGEWIERGMVTATPGPTVDYDYILADIFADAEKHDITELAFDPYMMRHIVKELEEGLSNTILIPYRQDLKQISGPTKQYEKLVIEDRIIDGNPVMAWMVTNAVVKPDVNGNYKVLKDSKGAKVDGVITSIMSTDRCLANAGETGENGDFGKILSLFR